MSVPSLEPRSCSMFQNVEQLGTDRQRSPVLERARRFDLRRLSVRINISRRAQVGVPEQLLYEFQVAGLLVDNRRGRVPERMEASSPAVASDSEPI